MQAQYLSEDLVVKPVGDYFAGTNHVLPTNSTARFSSGLYVDDFLKKQVLFIIPRKCGKSNIRKSLVLARMERLEGHARAVESEVGIRGT